MLPLADRRRITHCLRCAWAAEAHFPLINVPEILRWRFVRFVFKVTNTCDIFWAPQCFTFTHGVWFMHAEIISIAVSVNSLCGDETRCCFIWTEIWAGKGNRKLICKGCWSATGALWNPGITGFCYVPGVCLEERLDQHPLARHAFSWERILVCCFRGAGFRWGTGKVWLLCTTGLRSKLTSQTIGRRVLSLHT